jgi:hypothetical protein
MRKETNMGVRLIIMRKVKWTLIEFADLHGELEGFRLKILKSSDMI